MHKGMKMRSLRVFAAAAVLLFLWMSASVVLAAEDTAQEATLLYVTITDGTGQQVLAHEEIAVTDLDGDGVLTADDALRCAHIAKYEGGEDGYGSADSSFGRSLTKLWGVENGGSYGYYLNHTSMMSLLDPVKGGDVIAAFVYTDVEGFSDTYCFFDVDHAAVMGGETLTLTLAACGYDAEWNPITVPVDGATILINGQKSSYVTDAEGKVELQFDGAGYCIVSAEKDGVTLVPPACAVAVRGDHTMAGDGSQILLYGCAAVLALVLICLCLRRVRRYKVV